MVAVVFVLISCACSGSSSATSGDIVGRTMEDCHSVFSSVEKPRKRIVRGLQRGGMPCLTARRKILMSLDRFLKENRDRKLFGLPELLDD